MSRVEYIRNRLFIDGINCKFDKDDTCQCSTPGCPSRVKVVTAINAFGKKEAVAVANVLFEHHWHDETNESVKNKRKRIAAEVRMLTEKADGWEEIAAQHARMKEKITLEGLGIHSDLFNKKVEKTTP